MDELKGKINDGGERMSYGQGTVRFDFRLQQDDWQNGTNLVPKSITTEIGKRVSHFQDMLTPQNGTWISLLWVWKMKTI